MKRILTIMLTSLVVFAISVATLYGQEKNTGEKIKIVVNDDNGTRVIVDTIFKDGSDSERIKLDDGNVIFIAGHDSKNDHGGSKHITVTVTSDDENGEKTKEVKEIRIITSDSSDMSVSEGGKKVYVITSESDDHISGNGKNVAVWTSKGDEQGSENVYVVKKSAGSDMAVEKTVRVHVTTDGKETSSENARYIVAKDGLVVTVEGEDEARAKELMKVIEEHLGVNNKNDNKEVKSETKKNKK